MKSIKSLLSCTCASLMIVTASVQAASAAGSAMPTPQSMPALTKQERERLTQVAPRVACGPAKSVAVSVEGFWLGSAGDDSIVSYPNQITSEGGAWIAPSTFVAPCAGMYSFSLSMGTDSFYACPAEIGTTDDVWVYLIKSSPPLYNDTHVVGDAYGAWRGETFGTNVKRGQASYTVNLRLNAGDAIQTKVASDGHQARCLLFANFTANREFK